MEILTKLGVNWQLLLAQLFNFVVLMAILTYFVYKPILKILDDRRERIRKSVEEAKQIDKQRREIEQFKIEQLKKIDQETTAFLDAARVQADKVKREILDNAQKEADIILVKANKQLAEERVKLVSEMQAQLAAVSVRLAEKVLEREFTKDDQKRVLASLEQAIPALLK